VQNLQNNIWFCLVIADMFWIVLGLVALTAESRAGSRRPHIVFILADDVVSLNKNDFYLPHRGSKRTEGKKQVGYTSCETKHIKDF
jgi:hypothetical protein